MASRGKCGTKARSILASAVMQAGAGAAVAGTFDVEGPEVTKGETEIAYGVAWQRGFPVNSDFIRQSHEVQLGDGLTERFKLVLKTSFEQQPGADLEASSAGVQAQYVLLSAEKSPVALAWLTAMDVGLKSGESEVLTFGPLLGFKLGRNVDVTLNPLFQRSWNPSTPGLDFTCAWQVRTALNSRFGIGAEGYGTIPDIANAPGVDFQEHRVGPVLYVTQEVGGGPTLEIQLGLLRGLTEATADTTGRAKMAITW